MVGVGVLVVALEWALSAGVVVSANPLCKDLRPVIGIVEGFMVLIWTRYRAREIAMRLCLRRSVIEA